jgi:hypothetical protein
MLSPWDESASAKPFHFCGRRISSVEGQIIRNYPGNRVGGNAYLILAL